MPVIKLKLKGKVLYLLDRKNTKKEGAIMAKPYDYITFNESYAHLYPDGNISRYGETIGTIKDIKFLGEVKNV